MTGWYVIGGFLLITGTMNIWKSLEAAKGRSRRSMYWGLRTQQTLSTAESWRRTHLNMAPILLIYGVLTTVAGLAAIILADTNAGRAIVFTAVGLSIAVAIVGMLVGLQTARQAGGGPGA